MTTPTDTISMSDVNVELSKASNALITLNDTDVRDLAGIPSGTISMNDLRGKSAINFGTVTANFTTRSEGQSFTFTISGGTLANGTYYWRVDHITTSQFDFAAVDGSFTVTNNAGSFTVTTVLDALMDTNETFRVVLGNEVGVPVVYVTGPTCTITNATNYGTLTATPTSRVEGNSFSISLSGATLPNGTYYWLAENLNNLDYADFVLGSGEININNGTGSFTVQTVQDTNWEGTGTFIVSVGEVPYPNFVTRVSTGTLTITDYSSASASSSNNTLYRLGSTNTGTSIQLVVSNGPVGTYYWKITNVTGTIVGSGTVNSGDITQALTGTITTSGTVSSNQAFLAINACQYTNGATVSQKVFKVEFFSDAARTILVASTPNITILAAPTYTFSSHSRSTLHRIGQLSCDTAFTLTNFSGTRTFYWNILSVSGTVDASNDLVAISGSTTNSFGTVTITTTPRRSLPNFVQKSYQVRLYNDVNRTELVATSTTITLSASPTFSFSYSPTSINEGSSSTLSITTTNFPPSPYVNTTDLWYSVGGTATIGSDYAPYDLTNNTPIPIDYRVGLGNGTSTVGIYAKYDGVTDGGEYMTYTIRLDSPSGTDLGTSPNLTINNFLGSVTGFTATRTGGATSGSSCTITCQITSIPAYWEARVFNVAYSLNGAAYTNLGLNAPTIEVPANATSSAAVAVFINPSATTAVSTNPGLIFRLQLAGHNDRFSTAITGGFV